MTRRLLGAWAVFIVGAVCFGVGLTATWWWTLGAGVAAMTVGGALLPKPETATPKRRLD